MPKKVLLSLPDEFISKIDEICKEYNFERTEFIRQTLREKIYGYRVYKKDTKDISKDIQNVPSPENFNSIAQSPNSNTPHKGLRDGDYTWEWCQANLSHPFERGKVRKCLKVTVVDSIEGNDAYFKGKYFIERFMCEECIAEVNTMEGLALKEVQE